MTLREEAINDIKAVLHGIRMKVNEDWYNTVTTLDRNHQEARKAAGGGGEGEETILEMYMGINEANKRRDDLSRNLDIIETIAISLLKE